MDCMSGRVIGDSAPLVMSDSLNGNCGENGHNTAIDIRVQT